MHLLVKTHLVYSSVQPCEVLLQIEPSTDAGQICRDSRFSLSAGLTEQSFMGEEGIGTRRWLRVEARMECDFEARVEISRPQHLLERLHETPRAQLPSDAIKYLMPSRYCHSELFQEFVAVQFGDLTGGALVQSMSDWVRTNFRYDNGASHSGTSATDSFASLSGVCRDYAHVLIAFVRAAGIPARFVSAYGPDVSPPDFHAVVEVYLEGGWRLIDPSGMASQSDIVRICVGRDAADASFMTSYGLMDFQEQTVEVTRVHI